MERPRSSTLSITSRYWLVVTGILLVWAALGWLVAPRAIAELHAGRGPAFLAGLLAGRESVPLDRYLRTWEATGRSLTFLAVFGVLLGYIALRLIVATRVAPSGGGVASDAGGERGGARRGEVGSGHGVGGPVRVRAQGGPLAGWGGWRVSGLPVPVQLGIWFGLLGGLGEGLYVLAKGTVMSAPVGDYAEANTAVIWTAPLAVATTFGVIGLVVSGAGAVWRRFPAALVATALFAGLVAQAWLMVPGRVSVLAAAVFSVGAAVQAARVAKSRLGVFVPYVRRSIPRGLAVVAMLAVVQLAAEPLRAWWHLRGAPAPPTGTNVLLIVLDTQRADRLGVYGYERPTTPELERWAGSVITFENAYSPAGWTFPSHASLFTGRMFVGRNLGWQLRNPLEDRETTLAEVLGRAGYATAAFVGNLRNVNPHLGLGQGFLTWSGLHVTPRTGWLSAWWNRRIADRHRDVMGAYPSDIFLRGADDVNRHFLRWLDRSGERPFFAFLNYIDPHAPYGAPAPFAGRYRRGRDPIWPRKGDRAEPYSAEELRALSAAYDEEVAYLDHNLGVLLDELEGRGILDRTLVVITSDHGEQFGEHGFLDHGQNLYSALTHVPLLVRLPDGAHGGTRIGGRVGVLDVAPTLLDVVGLSDPGIGGASLSAYWRGGASPRPAFSYFDNGARRMRSVHYRDWHYIEDEARGGELYDLQKDPDELHNVLASAGAPLIAELRGYLRAAAERPEPAVATGAERSQPAVATGAGALRRLATAPPGRRAWPATRGRGRRATR